MSISYLSTEIEFVKGVGPSKGKALKAELGIKTILDLLSIYPFRYIDKTNFQNIKDARRDGHTILIKGTVVSKEIITGKNRRQRLSVIVKDPTGFIELLWFQGAKWLGEKILEGKTYVIYGKINVFGNKKSIPHPEMEEFNTSIALHKTLDPIYSSTEKLDKVGMDSKGRRKILKNALDRLKESDVPETLPKVIIDKLKFPSKYQTYHFVHFPKNEHEKNLAVNRTKFEEFFFLQLQLIGTKQSRKDLLRGLVFEKVGPNFNEFYTKYLPFKLTNAQKRVVKEIRADVGAGFQMNRLLQGDVGSGKTIVALLAILLAIDNGYQACLMAPTEILANQHLVSIKELLVEMDINVSFLSGSVKGKKRKIVLAGIEDGSIDLLIGTHALIENNVVFKNIGLSITDEQHRFGVAQRAKLWNKADKRAPHILVMTATPIPRTLAMTMYGDLDVSIIDELPPGRKEVKTIHKFESFRPQVLQFMHAEIKKGRQIYVVFPLIEESETLDLKNLQSGYERLLQYFPIPDFQISVVHGRMKAKEKEFEMERFVNKRTQIMVATTVIEVGVNVPNASVMIIENSERFGLSQLHQLRGRVGRGADQSFCILMSGNKVSKEARFRLNTMVRTNNGFEIAEADLEIRGPGEIEGTRQSGVNSFKLLNLLQDTKIINAARLFAEQLIEEDPKLEKDTNHCVKNNLEMLNPSQSDWHRIS